MIYIFSGLLSSLFPRLQLGTREIESILDEVPLPAQHRVWNKWRSVLAEILAERKNGDRSPVCLVGHSNGVLAALAVARGLDARNVPVHYVGAIDPTAARMEPVGGNVAAVDEFWASSGVAQLARSMSGNTRGACQFTPRFGGVHQLFRVNSGHVALAGHDLVTERVSTMIRRIYDES